MGPCLRRDDARRDLVPSSAHRHTAVTNTCYSRVFHQPWRVVPPGNRSRAARSLLRARHVCPVRTAVAADHHPAASRAAARADRVLLALCPPGQRLVRRPVHGRLRAGVAGFAHSAVHGPHRHPDHVEPTGDAVHHLLADARRNGPGVAGAAPVGADRPEHHGQPGDRRQRVEPNPLAEPLAFGMWCARAGRSSRTTSPAASPTG
jgi:hypothetical protein